MNNIFAESHTKKYYSQFPLLILWSYMHILKPESPTFCLIHWQIQEPLTLNSITYPKYIKTSLPNTQRANILVILLFILCQFIDTYFFKTLLISFIVSDEYLKCHKSIPLQSYIASFNYKKMPNLHIKGYITCLWAQRFPELLQALQALSPQTQAKIWRLCCFVIPDSVMLLVDVMAPVLPISEQ